MKKVYIVEIQNDWDPYYDIDSVFADKEKALEYAASYIVSHWAPSDDDVWQDEMEETGKYISKFDFAKEAAENGEWFARVTEYDVV